MSNQKSEYIVVNLTSSKEVICVSWILNIYLFFKDRTQFFFIHNKSLAVRTEQIRLEKTIETEKLIYNHNLKINKTISHSAYRKLAICDDVTAEESVVCRDMISHIAGTEAPQLSPSSSESQPVVHSPHIEFSLSCSISTVQQ